MSLVAVTIRELAMNWRFAVNGIQKAFKSFGFAPRIVVS